MNNMLKVGCNIIAVFIMFVLLLTSIDLIIANITYWELNQEFDQIEKIYGVSKGCTTTTAFEVLFDKVPVYPGAITNIQVNPDTVTITHRTQTLLAIPIGEHTYTCERSIKGEHLFFSEYRYPNFYPVGYAYYLLLLSIAVLAFSLLLFLYERKVFRNFYVWCIYIGMISFYILLLLYVPGLYGFILSIALGVVLVQSKKDMTLGRVLWIGLIVVLSFVIISLYHIPSRSTLICNDPVKLYHQDDTFTGGTKIYQQDVGIIGKLTTNSSIIYRQYVTDQIRQCYQDKSFRIK